MNRPRLNSAGGGATQESGVRRLYGIGIASAAEAATMILRIDDVIAASKVSKEMPPGGMPPGGMPPGGMGGMGGEMGEF